MINELGLVCFLTYQAQLHATSPSQSLHLWAKAAEFWL